jgi:hypothetical protein
LGSAFAVQIVTRRGFLETKSKHLQEKNMDIVTSTTMIGAAGYSLAYLLGGGGLIGAIAIYSVAKLMGK